MTKEEIKMAIAVEEDKRIAASDQIRRLKNDLIAIVNAECGLEMGEKVKVGTEYGIFAGHEFRFSDTPNPVVYKVKKDGTASAVRLDVYNRKIEKA